MPAQNVVIKGKFTINQYNYRVEYYYENVDGTYGDPDEVESYGGKANYQDVITYQEKDKNGTYVFSKVETAGVEGVSSLTISADETKNVIKVYYERNTFEYKVEYYKDSVNGEKLGTSDVKEQKLGTEMTAELVAADLGSNWLNAHKPTEGYKDGEVVEYITIQANNNNVINVVYNPRNDIQYTVEYYYNGELDNTGKNYSGVATFGGTVDTVTDYSNNGEWTVDTTKSTALPFEIVAVSGNVIKVYYVKPDISIEKTAPVTANVGDEITYTITLTNSGKVAGTATATDTLPEGLTYVTSDNGGSYNANTRVITWTNVDVPANDGTNKGTTILTVTVKVNENKIGATIINSASLSDDTPSTSETKTDTATTEVNEITATEIATKQGEQGKDSVNVVLVMDLSSSMNKKIFHECTHKHAYKNDWWGETYEYCPQGCEEQKDGTWGYYDASATRLSVAKTAAQNFINKIYTDENSKVTITVVTFNDKSGNSKYVGTKVLTFGNNQTTATVSNYEQLKTAIANIDIGTATSGYGTHIKAALDTTYSTIYGTNGLATKYPTNSNTVIFLGDGDPTPTRYDGFEDNTTNNIDTSATTLKNAGATIYSIGFGNDASNPESTAYTVLKNMSSNNTIYTANDSVGLAEIFTNIGAQLQPENPATTDKGIITVNLTNSLVVDASNPIVVEYNGTTLFSCTGTAEDSLSKYNLTYNSATKTLTFDINAYNANENNTTKITNNNLVIKYIIAR